MEIIAKKSTFLSKLYIALVVIWSLNMCGNLSILILDFIKSEGVMAIILHAFTVICNLVCMVIYVVLLLRLRCLPSELISRKDDTLYFLNGSCKIADVSKVERAPAKKTNPKYGNLSLYLGERKIDVRYVKNVVEAYDRLNELIIESKKENPNYDRLV